MARKQVILAMYVYRWQDGNMAENPANYVAIKVASEASGVPGRTLRHWVVRGKVAAINGHAGKLVRLDDVMRLAAMVGKVDGNATIESGKGGKGARYIATGVTTSPRTQLAAVMDEWVLPLVERIGALERENGMLTAERDALQLRLESLEGIEDPPSPHAAPVGTQREPEVFPKQRWPWWMRLLGGR